MVGTWASKVIETNIKRIQKDSDGGLKKCFPVGD